MTEYFSSEPSAIYLLQAAATKLCISHHLYSTSPSTEELSLSSCKYMIDSVLQTRGIFVYSAASKVKFEHPYQSNNHPQVHIHTSDRSGMSLLTYLFPRD